MKITPSAARKLTRKRLTCQAGHGSELSIPCMPTPWVRLYVGKDETFDVWNNNDEGRSSWASNDGLAY